MKRRMTTRRNLWPMICLLAIGPAIGSASAATFTWNGLSATSDDWSDGDNWVGGNAPANDGTADIHFAGSMRTTPNVDAAWSVNSITFDSGASAFNIDGSTVTLATTTGNAMTNSSANTQILAANFNFTGGFRNFSASSGDIQLTGDWTIASGSTIFARGGKNFIFDGHITGAGSISRTDPGILNLNNNANDFTGSLTSAHGVVVAGSIANAGVASAIGAGSTISLGQGTWGPSDTGTLRYTGASASTNRTIFMVSNGTEQASGTNGFSGRPTIDVTSASTTLTFEGNFNYAGSSTLGQWRFTGAGNGVINGNITTTGARIEKSGAGTWTLNGAAGNTGITEVKNGKLIVNSTLASTDVLVSGGATLGGGGTLAGNVNIASGGFLAPGSSIDTLGVDLDAVIAGTLQIEIDPTGAGSVDRLDVGGTLDISAATVDFDALAGLDDTAYIFASYGSLAGTQFATVVNLPTNYAIRYHYLGGNQIALLSIPEPASLTLLVIGAAALVRRRR